MTGVLGRRDLKTQKRHTEKMEAEVGVMLAQPGRPRVAGNNQKLEEARRVLLRALGRNAALSTP